MKNLNEDLSLFSIRLRSARTKLNMSQKELAELADVTAATISAYEQGAKSPALTILIKIANALNVSVDWLSGLSGELHVKLTNYADVANVLFTIDNSLRLTVDYEYNELGSCIYIGFYEHSDFYKRNPMEDFLTDWKKMKELYENETIDEEVYGLWKTKTLKKLSDVLIDPFDEAIPSFNIKSNDELPM